MAHPGARAGSSQESRRYPPPPGASGAPEFLTVETQETYVITGADDCQIVLTRLDLEELFSWWKAKRKAR